jgi:signal transduction histidine kinase
LRRVENSAELNIENSGAGIPPEVLPRVFERFFRGDASHSQTVEGCGLGLSIVQWIALSHNGSIQIASEPGQSTTATLRLPCN